MNLALLNDIHFKMNHHKFLIAYMGTFNQGILKSMMNVLERKLDSSEQNINVKKKIFHFMVECVQNICGTENKNYAAKFIFLIGKGKEGYSIFSAGTFSSERADKIKKHIDFINGLKRETMKETLYKELLSDTVDPDKMLMISLLDISKRTGQKLSYEVKEKDNDCYLSFSTTIS